MFRLGNGISSFPGMQLRRNSVSGTEKARRERFTGLRGPVLDIPFGLNVTQRTNLAMTPIIAPLRVDPAR
jgi:hypothetical protein